MTPSIALQQQQSIGDWLADAAYRHPSAALTVEGCATSVAEVDVLAGRSAAGFRALGLVPGDRVCLVMSAGVEALAVWFGLARAGLVEVPLNPGSGSQLLRYCIEQSGATVVVCDGEREAAVRECLQGVDAVRHLVVAGPGAAGTDRRGPEGRGARVHRVTLDEVLDHAADTSCDVDPASAAVILYTSGTTGPPKGVLLSHRANINLARHTVSLLEYTAADRLYSVFPLYHSNARYCSVMAAIESGADLVMHRRFSASRFWDICREHGITAFNYQGAMMSILHKQPPRPDDADNPVRLGFGAPCPPEIFADFERRFQVRLTEIYGSTEVSIVTDMPPWDRKIGTAGNESENYQVAVVDAGDEPVAAGTTGEIVVRPKKPGWMFDGYHRMPEATATSWRNLWFHTGDRGYLDDEGFLTFVDRLKDTVRRRGENISSWEIERVVGQHSDVAQVAAYGVPSELSEEEVMVAVVPRDGRTVDPAGLVAHCSGALTSFAVPRYVRRVEALPMTPSQRVEKYRLRAEGVTEDTWDSQGRQND
ncbi:MULTISPECIES: AMP-binding protein [Citricoccus]|uniref:AMP-binding protein n=1 Tax=Citricoccus TaxID=169133 RepID=UPI000255DFEA|nr:AMP-binding protein [Citricoccus sp. CH26A]